MGKAGKSWHRYLGTRDDRYSLSAAEIVKGEKINARIPCKNAWISKKYFNKNKNGINKHEKEIKI